MANELASPDITQLRLHPANGLPNVGRSIASEASEIRFGYAAITWGGNDVQAIKDISAVGFRGLQLRANVLKEFNDDPKTVADLLRLDKLQCCAVGRRTPRR